MQCCHLSARRECFIHIFHCVIRHIGHCCFYADGACVYLRGVVALPLQGCEEVFWSYNALRDHAQVCAAGVATEAFKCVKCSYSSKSEKNVKQHVKKHDWVSSTLRNVTG